MLVTICPECKMMNTFRVTTVVNFESDLHMKADGHIILEDIDDRVVEKIIYCCQCGYEKDNFKTNGGIETYMISNNIIQEVRI